MGSETRNCQNCKADFTIEPDDFVFYEKMEVPPPTFCVKCRAVRRFIHWNEHHLLRKKEAREGKEIFSTYPEHAPIAIYDHDYWWSDGWDPMQYSKDYDSAKPFFAQLKELFYSIPWPSRSIRGMVNSDYCNQASYFKNCYLCFNGNHSENCLYAVGFTNAKDSLDFYWSAGLELCYENMFADNNYESFFLGESANCRNSWFLYECDDCDNCFGCINLKHKQYHMFNVPYAKREYEKKLKEYNLGSHVALEAAKKKCRNFYLQFPFRYAHAVHNKNVTGDYVYNSRDVRYVFQGSNLENVRYSQNLGFYAKDSYDYTNWGENSELIYESCSVGDKCRNVKFCFDCWPGCTDIEYCMSCHSSSNLFGCFGLKKKQYCILNKQYSQGEYEMLRKKIIGDMSRVPYTDACGHMYRYGEFFPPEFSPLPYNRTIAQDYYPLTREAAEREGFAWRDPELREFHITTRASNLPDHINDVKDGIIGEIIECGNCKHAYRILAQEIVFYRRFGIPLPRLCHNCRFGERLKVRNKLEWHERSCMCAGTSSEKGSYANVANHFHGEAACTNVFETSYAPDQPEIVYCEQCYQAETV